MCKDKWNGLNFDYKNISIITKASTITYPFELTKYEHDKFHCMDNFIKKYYEIFRESEWSRLHFMSKIYKPKEMGNI